MPSHTDAEGLRIARRVARPYAHALVIKAEALVDSVLTSSQRQSLKGSMKEDLRKCGDAIMPDPLPYLISEAAAAAAADIGVTLESQTYASQPRFDRGRKLFHYEHYAPLETIVARLESTSSTEVALDVLEELLRVSWILKSEDRRLTELGFQYIRPDPAKAYEAAGIVLLTN